MGSVDALDCLLIRGTNQPFFCIGNIHVARKEHVVFHGQHLGHDTHCDFRRRFTSDLNAYGATQPRDRGLGLVEMFD